MRLLLFIAAILTASAGQAAACRMPAFDPAAQTLVDDKTRFAVSWRMVPARPKVGEFFAVEFVVCAGAPPLDASAFRVDATMPAHRHGMNFAPKISAIAGGVYRAEGMMFHMPGRWQLVFEQRAPGGSARVSTDIEIE